MQPLTTVMTVALTSIPFSCSISPDKGAFKYRGNTTGGRGGVPRCSHFDPEGAIGVGRNILRSIVVVLLQAIFVRFRLVKLIKICFSVPLNVRGTEKILGFPNTPPGALRAACMMAMAANPPPPEW